MDKLMKRVLGESKMGVSEAGTSSAEPMTFPELENIISSLIDDSYNGNTLIPEPKTLSDFFIADKLNYFAKVSANILETKKNFLRLYENINKNIEDMAREIVMSVNIRKDELVQELWNLKVKKVDKWDHQLAVCGEGMRQLRKKKSCAGFDYNFVGVVQLQQELKMIDAGDLSLDVDYQSIVKDIRNLGTLSSHRGPKWCNNTGRIFQNVTAKFAFGTSGDKPGQLCRPWGVCSDPTGRILVCDRSNHRIQIFDESGKFLLEFGEAGSTPGKFNRPTGIDVDAKCRIVVADKDNHRIQIFTYSGSYLFEFGTQGSDIGQFQYPWDVSVNNDCDIAVSDSKNHRIQLFNQHGRFITLFDATKHGIFDSRSMLKFLDCPRGLAFRPDGNLLATDFNNHRVLLICKDFRRFSSFGCEGICPGQFFRPQGIACDKEGRIAVSDSKNYRVQIFDSDGNILAIFGSQGTDPGQFNCPQGIAFHPAKNVMVVDLNNSRVQVF